MNDVAPLGDLPGTNHDTGYKGHVLCRIREDMVEWHMGAWSSGGKDYPEKMVFQTSYALAVLIANEVVLLNNFWWRKDLPEDLKGITSMAVICNDVFAWGCADDEDMRHDDIEPLYRMWLKDQSWGPAVWCIKRRNQIPQKPVEDRIRKEGIWDLDSLGVGPNTQDAEVKAWFAEWCAKERRQGMETDVD